MICIYYRYEYEHQEGDYDEHIGILTGWEFLSTKGEEDYISRMGCIAFFEDALPAPKCDFLHNKTQAWFTQKGNRKFNKAIRALVKDIESHGRKVIRIECEELPENKILYRDDYQVVILLHPIVIKR